MASTAETLPRPEVREGFDFNKVLSSAAFYPGVALFIGVLLCFWPLLRLLPELWLSKDGYYSHGFLVPLISGYIIYKRWDKLKRIRVRTGWLALPFLITCLYVALVATSTPIDAIMSLAFVGTLLCGVWLVAGIRWALALAMPILYLAFALPVWTMAIEIYTNPLQEYSTLTAVKIFQLTGFHHEYVNATTIMMNSGFPLNVGVPCSGLRLILALTAFTVFFVLIANLNWWRNVIMILLIVPLALLINGLRIALIGMVGEARGADAGMAFHDYSGYITLLVCFFILFKFARLLGWKD